MNEKRKKKLQIKYKKHTAATEKNTTQARERKAANKSKHFFRYYIFQCCEIRNKIKAEEKKVEIAEKK